MKDRLIYFFYALRPKHWVKNFFVFLPLIFGHKLFDAGAFLDVAASFFLFCMASSAVYLVNDLIDLENDRAHPTKRMRPIASGKVEAREALPAAAVLAGTALALAAILNGRVAWILAGYLVFNVLYTRVLKNLVIIDVFCLSLFFILRILAGTYAAEVAVSRWILLMAGLLALFLGFNKRRQELQMLGHKSDEHRAVLHKYSLYFIDQMVSVITASTVIAYTLYTLDARTIREVGSDHMMLTVPFVYYGIFRYLYLLHKRKMDGDPTRVLLSDFPMQLNVVFWLMTAIAVVYFHV